MANVWTTFGKVFEKFLRVLRVEEEYFEINPLKIMLNPQKEIYVTSFFFVGVIRLKKFDKHLKKEFQQLEKAPDLRKHYVLETPPDFILQIFNKDKLGKTAMRSIPILCSN